MTDHVDAETLAMLREGLLTADVAAVVGAHLAGCDRCGQADSQLAMVSELLASAPVPPMPPALSARIEAALAAEAATRAAAGGAAAGEQAQQAAADGAGSTPAERQRTAAPQPAVSWSAAAPGGPGAGPGRRAGAGTGPVPGRPPQRARTRLARSRARLGVMAAAAAIVVVGGVGYAVSQLAVQSGPAVQASGASAPRRASTPLGAPAAGVAPASPAPAGAAGPRLISTVTSGTNYLAGQLSTQLRAVLKHYPAGSSQPWPAGGWRGLPATGIAACVNAVTGDQHPRLVDIARYQGKPAMIIVVGGQGTAPARAWVVAPDCTAARHHVITQITLPGLG